MEKELTLYSFTHEVNSFSCDYSKKKQIPSHFEFASIHFQISKMDLFTMFTTLMISFTILTTFLIYQLGRSDRENRRYTNSRNFREGEHC